MYSWGWVADPALPLTRYVALSLLWASMPASVGDIRDSGSVLGLGRSLRGGHGNPLQFLAWRIPWTEGPGRLQSMVCKESDITEST